MVAKTLALEVDFVAEEDSVNRSATTKTKILEAALAVVVVVVASPVEDSTAEIVSFGYFFTKNSLNFEKYTFDVKNSSVCRFRLNSSEKIFELPQM